MKTHNTSLGVHYVDLPSGKLPAGVRITFTLHWLEPDKWEGREYRVAIE